MDSAPYSGAAADAFWGAFMLLESWLETSLNIGDEAQIVSFFGAYETRTGSDE